MRAACSHDRAHNAVDLDIEIFEHRASGKLAGERCRLSAADRRAIAGDVDAGAAASLAVGMRKPLAEYRVVAKFDAGEIGELRFGLEPKAVRHSVA